MNVVFICAASAIISLSCLVRMSDLPRRGSHVLKIALGLSASSAILFALLVAFERPIPIWILSAGLVGHALEIIVTSPLPWLKWIRHGERRSQTIVCGLRRRKTDHV